MFQLISFIKESQRHFDPFWIFTWRRPTYWQRLERKERLFDPYLVRKDENKAKAEGLKFSKQTLNRRYRFLSIFFNCSVPGQRYWSLRNSLTEYRKWLHRQSRWYNFWYNRVRPWTAQILAGVTFYLIAQFGMFFFMWAQYHYKKRTLVYLYKFIWYSVIKKILFLSFCLAFLFTEVASVFLFPCSLVLLYILGYVIFCRVSVFFYSFGLKNRVFERGVLLSSPYINKYGLGSNSVAIRRFFQLNWRLAGNLNTRYVKVLERFYGNQFPYRRSEDDLFLDYLGIRNLGWLKLDFPISRVGFYSSFFPNSLIARFPRLYRWRDLPNTLHWVGFWRQRRALKANERFYTKNIILYTKSSERLRFKTHNPFYNELLLSYVENLKSNDLGVAREFILPPFVAKRYPWWFYREKSLAFRHVRIYLVNLFSLYKNVSPWFGDLFNIGRRRRRKRNYFYFFNYGIFIVRASRGRLLNWGTRSLRYRLDSTFYNSFFLRLKMFLHAFFWRLFYPLDLVFSKFTFIKVLMFFFFFSFLIVIFPKSILLVCKALFF